MAERKFRAGAGMADLTPDRVLTNYNGALVRPSPDASPLMCHAVVFDDGAVQGAMVSCDATFVDRMLLLTIRDTCARATEIPMDHILVAATHSHATPATCPSFLSGSLPDPLYVDFFVEQVCNAVKQARANLAPAVLVSGECTSPGFEYNRRLLRPSGLVVMDGASNADSAYPPAGPVDSVVPFLAFEDASGKPIAVMVNYACHNNSVGGVYHSDIGGRTGEAIRRRLEIDVPTPFLEAPCGDVIWHKMGEAHARGDARATEIGEAIGEVVVNAYRAGERQEVGEVKMVQEVLEIADRSWEESTFCRDDSRGDRHSDRIKQRRRYDPEEEAILARGKTVCSVEIQGISFGDTAIVTNPAELFVAFGIEIRERSPFGVTLISELTNGYCGYVPTEKGFEEQGYEAHRTVYTSRLEKEGGRRIVEASMRTLEKLRG